MANGTARSSRRLVSLMMTCIRSWAAAFCCGLNRKPMPPPDMPPSIQKPQKSVAELGAHAVDQRSGVEVAGPRNDGLDRAVEIALGGGADALACRPRSR